MLYQSFKQIDFISNRCELKGRFVNALFCSLLVLIALPIPYLKADTNTMSQTVTYVVPAVTVLSVSGNVNFANFSTPPAGQNFTSVTDTSTTYNVSNNAGTASRKVTGALTAGTPTGLALYVTLTPPSGAVGVSNVLLSTTSQNLVTGINSGAFPGNQISYQLTADVAQAAIASAQTVSVQFTLVSGS